MAPTASDNAHADRSARADAEAEAAATEARRRQARARTQEQPQGSAQRHAPPPREADSRWSSNDPYVVLGVPPGADPATIRSAFTTLVSQYHPDKVARLAPEFQQLADERMKAINAAYARVRTDR